MMREHRKPKFAPCALCGKESEIDCWQYVLCSGCFALWHKDVQPPPENARWNPDSNTRQAAWRTQTLAWLEKAKKARAA
jgi:hypothetical protein